MSVNKHQKCYILKLFFYFSSCQRSLNQWLPSPSTLCFCNSFVVGPSALCKHRGSILLPQFCSLLMQWCGPNTLFSLVLLILLWLPADSILDCHHLWLQVVECLSTSFFSPMLSLFFSRSNLKHFLFSIVIFLFSLWPMNALHLANSSAL